MAQQDDGFTLMELLIVVTILGILASVVALSVSTMTGAADESSCLSDERTLLTAAEAYFAQMSADSIPATGTVEPYEQTLVEAGFLAATSEYHDLDAAGVVVTMPGGTCAA